MDLIDQTHAGTYGDGTMTNRHFEAATIDDLMRAAVGAIITGGVHISPSKGSCRELAAVAEKRKVGSSTCP